MNKNIDFNNLNGEFDIVINDKNGYIFYEAKFKNTSLTNDVINEKIDQVNKANLEVYKYGFISRSGYQLDKNKLDKNILDKLILISIDDLYY